MNGQYVITASEIDGGSYDNCSITSLEVCAPSSSNNSSCNVVDFEGLSAGTNVTTQLSGMGIANVSATGGINQAWIFDSRQPNWW